MCGDTQTALMIGTNYTKELAGYIVDTEFKSVPKRVLDLVKSHVMDTVGIAIAAPEIEETLKATVNFVREMGGKKESTVIRYGDQIPCLNAVFANSMMAHSIGFDDTHIESSAHCEGVVVPAAISVSEREGANGKELITAVVVGYDVMARVGMALNPDVLYSRGYHPSSVCATFGCATVAGKLLGLNVDQMVNALGLAAVQSGGLVFGLKEAPSSWFLQYARGAQSGVLSALLAKIGFTGPADSLKEFLRVYSSEPNLQKLTEGLGKRFEIERSCIKPYACCQFLVSGVDVLLCALDEKKIDSEEIGSINLKLPSAGVHLVDNPEAPRSALQARLSAQYVLAFAAKMGKEILDPKQLLIYGREDKGVLEFSKRVKVTSDSELNKNYPGCFPAIVEVTMKGKERYSNRVDFPRGSPENPITRKEIENKFRILASSLGDAKIKKVIETINTLEKVDNVTRDLITPLIVARAYN
jgi:2-methylcitrate dehydratase PrpD